jgi:hypothetical protein
VGVRPSGSDPTWHPAVADRHTGSPAASETARRPRRRSRTRVPRIAADAATDTGRFAPAVTARLRSCESSVMSEAERDRQPPVLVGRLDRGGQL